MMNFFRKSLSRLLIIQFALAAIIPMLIVAIISYNYAKSALQEKAFGQLVSLREAKSTAIVDHLRDVQRRIDHQIFPGDGRKIWQTGRGRS